MPKCAIIAVCLVPASLKRYFPQTTQMSTWIFLRSACFARKPKFASLLLNYFVFWFCFSMSLMYSKVNGNICNLCHLLMRLKLNKKCLRLKKPTNTWSTTNIGDLLRTTRLPTGVIYWELQQVFVINHMTWWIWFEIDYFSVNDWYLRITSITNELVIF